MNIQSFICSTQFKIVCHMTHYIFMCTNKSKYLSNIIHGDYFDDEISAIKEFPLLKILFFYNFKSLQNNNYKNKIPILMVFYHYHLLSFYFSKPICVL